MFQIVIKKTRAICTSFTFHVFFPFRNEFELCCTPSGTDMEKLTEVQVLTTVNENEQMFEPFADVVDLTLSNFHANLSHNQDSYAQQHKYEVGNLLHATSTLLQPWTKIMRKTTNFTGK